MNNRQNILYTYCNFSVKIYMLIIAFKESNELYFAWTLKKKTQRAEKQEFFK